MTNASKIIIFGYVLTIMVAAISCKQEKVDGASHADKKDSVKLLSSGFVFEPGQPFAQCHASTVLHIRNGNFLVAWFGGTHEKHDDVGIWLSKGKPGQWSAPVEIAKIREDAHWNPVLFRAGDGDIILYFKVGKTIDHWETWYKRSADGGETWSEARSSFPAIKVAADP